MASASNNVAGSILLALTVAFRIAMVKLRARPVSNHAKSVAAIQSATNLAMSHVLRVLLALATLAVLMQSARCPVPHLVTGCHALRDVKNCWNAGINVPQSVEKLAQLQPIANSAHLRK